MAYSTATDTTAYALARGYTMVSDVDVSLTLASDWLETRNFNGEKVVSTQTDQFPRALLYVDGVLLDSTVVPQGVKDAEMQMAMEIDKGFEPFAVSKPQVIRKRLEGIVETEYAANGISGNRVNSVMPLLRKYLKSSGGLHVVSS